ncbi:hypothetical protein BN1263250050 [Stenotrophomonas indicatrix]|nr:hypothetical protein BN1263250050 [Stenotrophomonas indicatrix]
MEIHPRMAWIYWRRRVGSGEEPPESGGGREAAGVWGLVSGARGSRSEAWERQRACDGAYQGAALPINPIQAGKYRSQDTQTPCCCHRSGPHSLSGNGQPPVVETTGDLHVRFSRSPRCHFPRSGDRPADRQPPLRHRR